MVMELGLPARLEDGLQLGERAQVVHVGAVVARLERCSRPFRSQLIITQNRRAAHQVQHMDIARPQPPEEPRLTSPRLGRRLQSSWLGLGLTG